MRIAETLILALACATGWAQPAPCAIQWSAEVDAVPFATGGWYGSLAAGSGAWRLRGVVAEVHPPSTFEPKGWTGGRTRAQALLLDRFFEAGFNGPWTGFGVERWEERIRPDGQPGKAAMNSLQGTLGAGWVYRMGSHFTLNPWMAAHARMAGDREAQADGQVCRPRRIQAEASVKAGWAW